MTPTYDLRWICRECKTKNVDDFIATSQPVCSNCDNTYDWDDVISQDEMDAANDWMVSLEHEVGE